MDSGHSKADHRWGVADDIANILSVSAGWGIERICSPLNRAAASSENEEKMNNFVVFIKRKMEFIPSSEMKCSKCGLFGRGESDKTILNKTHP